MFTIAANNEAKDRCLHPPDGEYTVMTSGLCGERVASRHVDAIHGIGDLTGLGCLGHAEEVAVWP